MCLGYRVRHGLIWKDGLGSEASQLPGVAIRFCRRGFTLIELLVVIAIIAVLVCWFRRCKRCARQPTG